jgi:hypothetical protein
MLRWQKEEISFYEIIIKIEKITTTMSFEIIIKIERITTIMSFEVMITIPEITTTMAQTDIFFEKISYSANASPGQVVISSIK